MKQSKRVTSIKRIRFQNLCSKEVNSTIRIQMKLIVIKFKIYTPKTIVNHYKKD